MWLNKYRRVISHLSFFFSVMIPIISWSRLRNLGGCASISIKTHTVASVRSLTPVMLFIQFLNCPPCCGVTSVTGQLCHGDLSQNIPSSCWCELHSRFVVAGPSLLLIDTSNAFVNVPLCPQGQPLSLVSPVTWHWLSPATTRSSCSAPLCASLRSGHPRA